MAKFLFSVLILFSLPAFARPVTETELQAATDNAIAWLMHDIPYQADEVKLSGAALFVLRGGPIRWLNNYAAADRGTGDGASYITSRRIDFSLKSEDAKLPDDQVTCLVAYSVRHHGTMATGSAYVFADVYNCWAANSSKLQSVLNSKAIQGSYQPSDDLDAK